MLRPDKIKLATKIVFVIWLVLLIPWFVFAPLAAMAFDPGPSRTAEVFVWSTWTYPVSVLIVGLLRRKAPWVVLLPVVNLAGFFFADYLG